MIQHFALLENLANDAWSLHQTINKLFRVSYLSLKDILECQIKEMCTGKGKIPLVQNSF
jgi:hypothetical protein